MISDFLFVCSYMPHIKKNIFAAYEGLAMYTEIERKFLVNDDTWRQKAIATKFCQGYIYSAKHCFVRVRTEGHKAYLTLKGPKNGIARPEFEFEIPTSEARELLENMAYKPLIHKIRHTINIDQHLWEIDEFCNENTGLIVAEIELKSEGETFKKPSWLGKEVTFDARYRNASLAKFPYSQWLEKN